VHVHRLIFRLDFQRPNFSIIDAPGTVMRLLSEMGEAEYWPEFKDASATRSISVSAHDAEGAIFRQFSVEHGSLYFVFESVPGRSVSSIFGEKTVANLFKGIHTFREHFDISQFSRAGIRFIALGNVKAKGDNLLPNFSSLIDRDLRGCVTGILGDPKDVGVAFDGEGADKIGYHVSFGPYGAEEGKKHFSPQIAKKIEEKKASSNLVIDTDFFELNFAMTVKAPQWCAQAVEKTQKFHEAIKQLVSARA
jgi:hypothetical protein